jgi:hypothetical protein
MEYIKKHWKTILIILLVLAYIGKSDTPAEPQIVTKEVEKVVEVIKTPQACKDLVDLDNKIFTEVGSYFGKISTLAGSDIMTFLTGSTVAMEELNAFVDKNNAKRLELANNCINN